MEDCLAGRPPFIKSSSVKLDRYNLPKISVSSATREKKTCEKFCCNPLHLEARGLDDVPIPSKIENIQLNYVNIFEHFKKADNQIGGDRPESLSP